MCPTRIETWNRRPSSVRVWLRSVRPRRRRGLRKISSTTNVSAESMTRVRARDRPGESWYHRRRERYLATFRTLDRLFRSRRALTRTEIPLKPHGGLKRNKRNARGNLYTRDASSSCECVWITNICTTLLLQTYLEYYHSTIAPRYVPTPTKIAVFVDVALIHP